MKNILKFIILLSLAIFIPIKTFAQNQEIVVTIKPIYSLLIGVSGARSKVGLLINNNSSPHDHNLKPSDLKLINNSKIIFYVDDNYELFLKKPFENLPASVVKVNILQEAKINLIKTQPKQVLDSENHGSLLDYDVHFWLDPNNAIKIVNFFARKLSQLYPELKEVYEKNAENMVSNLKLLDSELKSLFEDVKNEPFLSYHDAYKYFSRAYNLKNLGSITNNPESPLTAADIMNAKEVIKKNKVKCLFGEAQFNNKIIKQIASETDIDSEILDPIGGNLQNNHNQYFKMIRLVAYNMKKCLD